MNSAGLADIFAQTSGQTSVSGVVGRDRLTASEYRVHYKTGKKGRAIDVRFRNGNVVSASDEAGAPNPEELGAGHQADMRNVVDPLSGLIFPGGHARLPEERADLRR